MVQRLLPFVLLVTLSLVRGETEISDLQGSADFKAVILEWKYGRNLPEPESFLIKYCEDQAWGKHRCKTKRLDELDQHEKPTAQRSQREFIAQISGLKMATKYTIEVSPVTRVHSSSFDRGRSLEEQIVIRTKGFSAKATNCKANSSVVEINTGPYFGGKISVEDSEDPLCSTEGDKKSARTKYRIEINHFLCGSEVINSSVTTSIVVQENLPILTHSTRRFMVVCTYVPETFTVRAGVNLPDQEESIMESVDQSINEVDPSELFDSSDSVFNDQFSGGVGRALKLSANRGGDTEPEMWAHLVMMVVLIMAAVVGLSCAIFHFVRQSRANNRNGFVSEEVDDISIEDSICSTAGLEYATAPVDNLAAIEDPVSLDLIPMTLDIDSHPEMLYNYIQNSVDQTICVTDDMTSLPPLQDFIISPFGGHINEPNYGPHLPINEPIYGPHLPINEPLYGPHLPINEPIYGPHLPINDPIYGHHLSTSEPIYGPHLPMNGHYNIIASSVETITQSIAHLNLYDTPRIIENIDPRFDHLDSERIVEDIDTRSPPYNPALIIDNMVDPVTGIDTRNDHIDFISPPPNSMDYNISSMATHIPVMPYTYEDSCSDESDDNDHMEDMYENKERFINFPPQEFNDVTYENVPQTMHFNGTNHENLAQERISQINSLILNPNNLPTNIHQHEVKDVEINRLSSYTPEPLTITLKNVPVDMTLPLSSLTFTSQIDLTTETDDDVFESDSEVDNKSTRSSNTDNDFEIESNNTLQDLTDEIKVVTDVNWKLGQEDDSLFSSTV